MSIQVNRLATPRDEGTRKERKQSSKKDREQKSEKKRKRHTEETEDDRAARKKQRLKDGLPSTSQPEPQVNSPQDSPFHKQTSSLYLPLSPISQLHPLEGLCAEHLSPLLLNYYPPFRGVILTYSNVRLSEHPTASTDQATPVLAKPLDEYGSSFVWVTADFLLLRPRRGQWIEGWINLQNEGHLGLVCWNLFNASIERDRLPKDWTWSGVGGRVSSDDKSTDNKRSRNTEAAYEDRGQGYFIDGNGKRVEGLIRFRVKDCEAAFTPDRGFLNLEGTLLDEEAEKELVEREQRIGRMKDRILEGKSKDD